MVLLWIDTQHDLYESERELRLEVLRKPLGIDRVEKFPFEDESLHLVALDGPRVVGCLLFHPEDKTGRLYQMAVAGEFRGIGMGKRLIRHLERRLSKEGFKSLYLHARMPVIGFYEKCGFTVDSDIFIEIGIEHRKMVKKI